MQVCSLSRHLIPRTVLRIFELLKFITYLDFGKCRIFYRRFFNVSSCTLGANFMCDTQRVLNVMVSWYIIACRVSFEPVWHIWEKSNTFSTQEAVWIAIVPWSHTFYEANQQLFWDSVAGNAKHLIRLLTLRSSSSEPPQCYHEPLEAPYTSSV